MNEKENTIIINLYNYYTKLVINAKESYPNDKIVDLCFNILTDKYTLSKLIELESHEEYLKNLIRKEVE